MSNNKPDDVYYDAFSDSAEEVKAKTETQDEFSEYDFADNSYAVYFELESDEYCDYHSSSNDNNSNQDEDDVTKMESLKALGSNMKKFNTLVRSKVNVSSRAEIFGGKKKKANQDKEGENGPKPQSQTKNGGLYKVEANYENSAPASQKVFLPTEDASSTYSLLQHLPADGIFGKDLSQAVPTGSRNTTDYNVCVVDPNDTDYDSYHVWSGSSAPVEASESVYELARPLPEVSKWTDTIKSTTSSITSSVNKGCLEGVGQAVPVDFINLHHNTAKLDDTSSDYEKLYHRSVESKLTENMREILKKRGYGSLASIQSDLESLKSEPHLEEHDFGSPPESLSEEEEEFSWGSEFDETSLQYQGDISDMGVYDKGGAPDKPLPPKPGKKAFMLRAKSSPGEESKYYDPGSTVCLPVTINPQKHPPPLLPPQPSGLTQDQIKRRMIIESIINSERSYLESLERVVKDYEKIVSESISQSKGNIRRVFAEMKEIISHHKMFQIELSERVKRWDKDEKIGDIFTASFSKTMLINAYSTYVNNFAASMEEIRTLQRSRQSFREFLLKQEKYSSDRLSIFGLMVKPVQRFPQFIMFLQDLIKYTPQYHHDRRALQLALTELENVAYRLNERKRQSEQKFQANQTIQQLIKQKVHHVLNSWNLDLDLKRRLIRTDIVEQVQGEFENLKCKNRRLILMNDMVLCVKVIQKEQSDYTMERLVLRWMAKLKDLELKDTAITPDMQSVIKWEPGKFHIISSQPEKPEDDPFHLYTDLREMVHDHSVLGQISGLLSILKRSYTGHGLREELVHEVSRDLQRMIQIKEEQLRLVNSCSIILQDTSRSEKPHYVLQTQTAAAKQDWCIDFLMAKLAQDRSNNLAWDGATGNDVADFDVTPAHFMKYVPVDVPKNYTKIRCAVAIFLNPEKSAYGIGVQHLWVCSSTSAHGQVSVLSIHNSKPALMESFKACNSDIIAVELVPGCGEMLKEKSFLFPEDTVWLTTTHKEILVFPLASQDGVHRQPLAVLRMPAVTVSLKFVDERLFCGFDDGAANVYSRKADGGWNVSHPVLLKFGTSYVKLHFVHEENIWLSCDSKLCQLEIDTLETQANYELASYMSPIDQVVKAGVGIWVSFHESSVIKLYHLETMENLQEISIGNFVNRICTEKLWTLNGAIENLVVTCLTVSRGLLWVGTSLGVVLTVPLPRLSDGVPLYRGCPKISLHAHKGPVRFLIPMHCSSNILELNRASSLRSTLCARPSRRNIEREKLELEESQKRKERMKNAGSAENMNVIGQDVISEFTLDHTNDFPIPPTSRDVTSSHFPIPPTSRDVTSSHFPIPPTSRDVTSSHFPIPPTSRDVTGSPIEEANVMLKNGGNNDNTPNKLGQTSANKNENKASKQKKSKTISFRTELAQRIMLKSNSLSRSEIDLSASESHEVEELYEILLEDEAGMEEGVADTDHAANVPAPVVNDTKWIPGNKTPATSSGSAPNSATPSWLNNPPLNQTKQNGASEGKPIGAQPFPVRVKGHLPSATSTSNSSSNNITEDAFSPPSPIIGFMRGRTSRLTTLRKASCNAVVVLSGGDGYCDLDLSRNQGKMDDACALLWVHKF